MLRCSEPKKRAPYSKWGEIILLLMAKMKIASNMIHVMSCLPPMKTRLDAEEVDLVALQIWEQNKGFSNILNVI